MALIQCPKCGKQYSSYAPQCPQCGLPQADIPASYKQKEEKAKAEEEKKWTNLRSTKMSFAEAIASCLKNYANFKGKASRSEYWWWVLFNYICFWIIGTILAMIFGSMPVWVAILVNIPLWIPSLAVSVRRCHDTNHSGWCVLIPIYNIVLMLLPSKD